MPRHTHPNQPKCGRCGRTFRSSLQVSAHERRAHPKPGQEPEQTARARAGVDYPAVDGNAFKTMTGRAIVAAPQRTYRAERTQS